MNTWTVKRITMEDGTSLELFPAREIAQFTTQTGLTFTMSMADYLGLVDAIKEMEGLEVK